MHSVGREARLADRGRKARTQYVAEFLADTNYWQLMEIYEGDIQEACGSGKGSEL